MPSTPPAPVPTQKQTTVLKLPSEGTGSATWWVKQLSFAEEVRNNLVEKKWRRNLTAYLDEGHRTATDIRVNIEFEKTEQKKTQLFFQVPEVLLTPELPNVGDAVRIFQRVVNTLIGPKKMNTKALMRELLFDVLCPSGIAACEVGYQSSTQGEVEVQVGEEPDPTAQPPQQPGAILGLGPTPPPGRRPVMESVPNVVSEKYFADRISPADFLVPPDFTSSDYDKAPWLGYDFWIEETEARRRKWIAKGEELGPKGDEVRLFDSPDIPNRDRKGQLRARKILYYASRVDPNEPNPEKVRKLVFIEGRDLPVEHEDSPYQRFDDRGRFVAGMVGLPVKVLTLRYVSDLPYPPSDCSASRRQADELSEGRTQMVKQRRRAVPLRWVNTSGMVDEDQVERIKKGDVQDIIALNQKGDEVLGEIARATYPRENFTFNEVVQSDIDR